MFWRMKSLSGVSVALLTWAIVAVALSSGARSSVAASFTNHQSLKLLADEGVIGLPWSRMKAIDDQALSIDGANGLGVDLLVHQKDQSSIDGRVALETPYAPGLTAARRVEAPLPTAVWMGLSMLAGLAVAKFVHHRSHSK